MSKTKTIFRDIASNRIITEQEATTRAPDTWFEEVFVRSTLETDGRKRKDMPVVKHLTP